MAIFSKEAFEDGGWATNWIMRKNVALRLETQAVSIVLCSALIFSGARTVLASQRCSRELKANPLQRTAIHSHFNKQLHRSTKAFFYVALAYLFHGLALWLFDGFLSNFFLAEAAEEGEILINHSFIQTLMMVIGMFVTFTSALTLFPLAQMIMVTWLLKRYQPKVNATTLESYITEGRIFSSYFAQVWAMVFFGVISWWALADDSNFWRVLVIEACIGSTMAWLDVSWVFNFRAERLAEIELGKGQCGSTAGSVRFLKHVAEQIKQFHSAVPEEKLPSYTDAVPDATQARTK